MPSYSETKSFAYKVTDDEEVVAEVTIGDGQGGGWAVKFGGKVTKGSDLKRIKLGTGKQVRGKIMQVSTIVMDIRPQTDRLGVETVLTGGTAALTCAHAKVMKPGDSAHFTTVVIFQ